MRQVSFYLNFLKLGYHRLHKVAFIQLFIVTYLMLLLGNYNF